MVCQVMALMLKEICDQMAANLFGNVVKIFIIGWNGS